MQLKLQKDFNVQHPISEVWQYFLDPMAISECIPGVKIEDKVDDRNYKGKISLEFGPISANFDALAQYESIDEVGKKIVLRGKGNDSGGAGNVDMLMDLGVKEVNGVSHIESSMQISIHGRMAQFGSRMIQDISDELFDQFVKNFTNKLKNVELKEEDKKVSVWKMMKLLLKRLFAK